ncbi:SymE family type I addiction module toxin [Fulvivirgaceae bacterium LMO-SS25]
MEQEEKFQQSGKRKLKVYQKYIPRSYHQQVIFPEIRLCGKWLRDMGFECGQSVTVRHAKNKITITADKETEK